MNERGPRQGSLAHNSRTLLPELAIRQGHAIRRDAVRKNLWANPVFSLDLVGCLVDSARRLGV
jgi:hypothetical protein